MKSTNTKQHATFGAYYNTPEYQRFAELRQNKARVDIVKITDLLTTNDKSNVIFDPYQYEVLDEFVVHDSYLNTVNKMKMGCNMFTRQMGALDLPWDYGYDVYILNHHGVPILISNETLDINRELRPAHNLFKLWRSGALGDQFR
jgi:hypothetical protein